MCAILPHPSLACRLLHCCMDARDGETFTAIDVDCYAGWRGDETPRRFGTLEAQVEVTEVVDRWLAPDHRYFKVRDREGAIYILRHDVVTGRWELTSFRRP